MRAISRVFGRNAISFTADRSLWVMSQFYRQTPNGGSDKCGGIHAADDQHGRPGSPHNLTGIANPSTIRPMVGSDRSRTGRVIMPA